MAPLRIYPSTTCHKGLSLNVYPLYCFLNLDILEKYTPPLSSFCNRLRSTFPTVQRTASENKFKPTADSSSHSHFLIPLRANTHLMDPVPVSLPLLFHHTSKVTAGPQSLFLHLSSTSSLLLLCPSLSLCLSVFALARKRERILAGTGNPQPQTGTLPDCGA